jgi:hypothetical protein
MVDRGGGFFSRSRHLESNCLMSENTPRAVAGVAECCAPPTLDKMMRDRKHLVPAEVEEPSWSGRAPQRTGPISHDWLPSTFETRQKDSNGLIVINASRKWRGLPHRLDTPTWDNMMDSHQSGTGHLRTPLKYSPIIPQVSAPNDPLLSLARCLWGFGLVGVWVKKAAFSCPVDKKLM